MKQICLLLCLVTSAYGANFLCRFSGLADGASEPEAEKLAVSTYSQLLESPAARHLTPGTMEKMVKAGDPYEPFDEPGADTLSLRRQLRQFKEILAQRKWETPALRDELLNALRRRTVDMANAQSTRQGTMAKTAYDVILPFPPKAQVSAIPGRADLLVLTKEPRELRILDFNTQALRSLTLSDDYFSEARMSADGTHVLLGKFKGQLGVVPFDGQRLDWTNARNVGDEIRALNKQSVRGFVSLGGNGAGERIVARSGQAYPNYVFSPATNQRFHLDYIELGISKERIVNWGRRGDGDQLFLLSRRLDDSKLDILVVDVGATGKLTLDKSATRRTETKDATGSLVWPPGGDTPLLFTIGHVASYPPGATGGTRLLEAGPLEQIVALQANANRAVALLETYHTAERQRLEFLDPRNGQRLGHIDLRGSRVKSIQLLPDGRVLLREQDGGNVRMLELNFRLNLAP